MSRRESLRLRDIREAIATIRIRYLRAFPAISVMLLSIAIAFVFLVLEESFGVRGDWIVAGLLVGPGIAALAAAASVAVLVLGRPRAIIPERLRDIR